MTKWRRERRKGTCALELCLLNVAFDALICANLAVIFRLMDRRRFLKRLHGELEEADENKKAKSASEPDPVIPPA